MEKNQVAQKHPERLAVADAPADWKFEGYTPAEIDAMIEIEKKKAREMKEWPSPDNWPDDWPQNI